MKHGLAGLAAAILLISPAAAQTFHTEPSCWDGPRIYHVGPPSAELARKIERTPNVSRTPRDNAVLSYNSAYKAWVEIPNAPVGNVADQILYIASEQDRVTRFYIEQAMLPVTPRWINEKLVFARIAWGRIVFTDIIIDAESGELLYQEEARDGQIAYDQFQQACGGTCPCDETALSDAQPPVSKPAKGEIVGHLRIDRLLNREGPVRDGLPVHVDVDGSMQEIARITDPAGIVTDGNEEWESALVYARRPGWYQIRLAGAGQRLGWVKAADTDAFISLPELLRDRLSYLGRNWDGRIWHSPDGSGGFALSALHDPGLTRPEHAITVTSIKETPTGTWLHVQLHKNADCTRSDETLVETGWVPAWSDKGLPVGGFYAKGC